ncbi:adenosine deaminase editase [Cytidiella melzeri]|nr:adenosine deaminase editase [Cytidiella melzeri]
MAAPLPDEIVSLVHTQYAALKFRPPSRQFTVLAAFVLSSETSSTKVISLGTGSKCLPAHKLQRGGDIVHDSHAEILARRGAVRFFLEEIGRVVASVWIEREDEGKFRLRKGVRVHLYISTPPCGDASTRYLASFQDEAMAALKDSGLRSDLAAGTAARGRDNYLLYGVLRTKPGRADSPPTLSMSCSDKIASWSVLGVQGALAARVLMPIYIDEVILGEVSEGMRDTVRADCERALWKRLQEIEESALRTGYSLHRPRVSFTSFPFAHAKSTLSACLLDNPSSCNDSLCWIAGSLKSSEVLINGLRRGVPPKHLWNPKFRPLLSKIALFGLYAQTASALGSPHKPNEVYLATKRDSVDYQAVKRALIGEGAPFAGWVRSGSSWEEFQVDGSY